VLGMMAIFTYGFTTADEAFADANCKLVTLSDYHHLISLAAQKNYIQANQIIHCSNGEHHLPLGWVCSNNHKKRLAFC
ncbi:MAG: hypothetical protein RIQ33_801, partial [Bacteroidota bacterium]